MNHRIDSCLERLLRAAARVPDPVPCEAPFHLETRVLAAWRNPPADDAAEAIALVLRRAFVCACAILAICAALTFTSAPEPAPNELAILDSVIQLSLLQ